MKKTLSGSLCTSLIDMAGLLAAAALLTGCGGGGSDNNETIRATTTPKTQSVTLDFKSTINGVAASCQTTYNNVGSAAPNRVQIRDFRWYIHNVELIDSAGTAVPLTLDNSIWQANGVALLDFEDGTNLCANGNTPVNTTVTGTIPKGDYAGIRFTVGVPESLNHLDSASAGSPLNVKSLHWNWLNGYKFMRTDLTVVGAAPVGWNFHLGSTNCNNVTSGNVTAKKCDNSNRPTIELSPFDINTNAIQFDLGTLVSDNNLSTDQGGAPGCMSKGTDPECNATFAKLGLDINTGSSTLQQSVFSAVVK